MAGDPPARRPARRYSSTASSTAPGTWSSWRARRSGSCGIPTRLIGWPAEGLRSARALADSLRSATPETGLNEPISPRRHLARSHRPLADLKRIKDRFEATVNDVVLAVASGGVRRSSNGGGRRP